MCSTSDQGEMNVNYDNEDTETDIFFAKHRQDWQEMEMFRWDRDSIIIIVKMKQLITMMYQDEHN